MSQISPLVVISSDTESDSDIERIVSAAFTKAKEKIYSKKTRKDVLEQRRNITTTTTHVSRQVTRSSVRSADKPGGSTDENSDKTNITEEGDFPSFFVDTKPSKKSLNEEVYSSSSSDADDSTSEAEEEDGHVNKPMEESSDDSELGTTSSKKSTNELSSSLQTGVDPDDIYVNVRSFQNPQESQHIDLPAILLSKKHEEIMKKSVITPDFEKQDKILPYSESMRQLKMKRRKERATTKGSNWFNMPATELTEERKNDLKVLQMRHALDPKRFYRGNDMTGPPKYFQFGTVVESKADFYSSRIPKKQRKATLVEELMADADFRKYNKRRYTEIQEAKRMGTGPYQKVRFAKKKKKAKK